VRDGQFGVRVGASTVQAWSTTRLPFEPKGWMLDYRSALRTALRSIAPVAGLGLAARYYAPDAAVVDVENVLCYNIGSGAYAHLIGGGLRLNRHRSTDGLHHVTYQLEPIAPAELMPFAVVAAAVPTGTHSAGQWWSLLRPNLQLNQMSAGQSFGVEVHVSGSWTNSGLAAAVKPMLDGLVSALHAHDQSQPNELVPRLATLGDPSSVWLMLCDRRKAALGTRRLLRPHGPAGIAWNPADDLCTAISIVRSSPQARRAVRAGFYPT
jgi:hypothetical protein